MNGCNNALRFHSASISEASPMQQAFCKVMPSAIAWYLNTYLCNKYLLNGMCVWHLVAFGPFSQEPSSSSHANDATVTQAPVTTANTDSCTLEDGNLKHFHGLT